ncbi:MAG: DinB family protein [Pelobium sp.]
MIEPTSKKLEIIIPAFRMHSQSFKNVLDGITEKSGLKRIDFKTNHVVWMTGNLVNCRYWIGNLLGIEDKDPYNDLFKEGRALDENLSYPSLEELKNSFAIISPIVYQKLLEATDEQLDKGFSFGMNVPFVKENVLNMIGMCIGREDYLFGQIGLMRKMLDLKGMSYDIDLSITY